MGLTNKITPLEVLKLAMVGMFVCVVVVVFWYYFLREKTTGREFFVPAQT
jgi:hypothetical protein